MLNGPLFSFDIKAGVTYLPGSSINRRLDLKEWRRMDYLQNDIPRQERPRKPPIVPLTGTKALPVSFLFLHMPTEPMGHTTQVIFLYLVADATSQGHSLYLLKVGLLSPGSLCLDAFPRQYSKPETMKNGNCVDKCHCWRCCTAFPIAPQRDWEALARMLESRPVNSFPPHIPLLPLEIPMSTLHLNS